MKFKDAKLPQDTIEAVIAKVAHGSLIEIEIHSNGAEATYLDKESAYKLGEELIRLSRKCNTGIAATEIGALSL